MRRVSVMGLRTGGVEDESGSGFVGTAFYETEG